MEQRPPDTKLLFDALAEEDFRWVLIGGLALALYGGDHVTFDADLAFAFDRANREALVRALGPLHPRPLRLADGTAWEWDVKRVRGPWTLLRTDAGRVGLVVRLAGIDSFDGLYNRAEERTVFGHRIRLASLDDLISMKQTSERDKDREHVRHLRALKYLREGNRPDR